MVKIIELVVVELGYELKFIIFFYIKFIFRFEIFEILDIIVVINIIILKMKVF